MRTVWIVVLVGSVLLNLVAIWGTYRYVRYGGSPLSDLKRRITRASNEAPAELPYAKANAELRAAIERGEADPDRVVFLGASITQHWDFAKDLPGFAIINRGVGGEFARDLLVRFQRDVVDLAPRAVVIKLCSINIRPDIPQTILEDAMRTMTDVAVAHGIQPVVCTIIPVARPAARIGSFDVTAALGRFNEWLRAFARDRGYRVIDLAAAIGDANGCLPRECAADPIHPNERGYRILSGAVRPVLRAIQESASEDSASR